MVGVGGVYYTNCALVPKDPEHLTMSLRYGPGGPVPPPNPNLEGQVSVVLRHEGEGYTTNHYGIGLGLS